MNLDLVQQFKNLKLEEKANKILAEKAKALLPEMIDDLMFNVKIRQEITGNIMSSFVVGIFLDGKLISYDSAPNRAWHQMLKAGEEFNGFVGKVGNENGYAHDRAIKLLKEFAPKQIKGICFVCISGATYASYLDAREGYNVMSDFVDAWRSKGVEVVFNSVPW